MGNTIRTAPAIYPLFLIGWILTISACTMIPVQKHEDFPERLPMHFSGTEEPSSNTALTWEKSFPSKHLLADVRTLLGENFELKAARARVAQAAAEYGLARSKRFPSLEAKANIDRSRVKEDEPDGSDTTRNTIAFEAALTWELDIWGRLKTKQAAAALSVQEKQALVDQIALDLQTLLIESWVTHHAADKLKQVLQKQRETNGQFLALTELRFAHGQGSVLDVLQQKGRLVTTERNLPAVEARQHRAANAYTVLMGRFPDDRDLPEEPWPELRPLTTLTTPRRLLVDRPDLRAAFLALQAADHEVAAAIAARLPRLSIGLTVAESGSSLSQIGDGCVRRVAGGLLTPVFDAGRLKAKVAQRKAQARESLAVLEQAMRVAMQEVEDALARESAFFDEKRLLREEIVIARNSIEEATLGYVNGRESYLAVLTALVKEQTLQQKKITLEQELLINRGHLLKALGAKWSR